MCIYLSLLLLYQFLGVFTTESSSRYVHLLEPSSSLPILRCFHVSRQCKVSAVDVSNVRHLSYTRDSHARHCSPGLSTGMSSFLSTVTPATQKVPRQGQNRVRRQGQNRVRRQGQNRVRRQGQNRVRRQGQKRVRRQGQSNISTPR